MPAPTPHPMSENIDYSPTSNVSRLHAAVAREKGEPIARQTPLPLWIVVVIGVLCIMAGGYFGSNTSDFNDFGIANIKGYLYEPHFPGVEPPGKGGMTPLEQHQPENWIAAGKALFSNNCASCHSPTGEGQAGKYPPLKNSEFVINGERRLAAILLHGVVGALTVNGSSFNDQMQPLGTTALSNDSSLAQVLSYIRNDWGNHASVLYEDQIKALRKELGSRPSYSEAELRKIDAAANAPASKWPEELKKAAVPAAGTPATGAPATGAPATPGTLGATPPAPAAPAPVPSPATPPK